MCIRDSLISRPARTLSQSRSAPYLLPGHCRMSSYIYFHDVQTIISHSQHRCSLWASYLLSQHRSRSSYITSCQLKAVLNFTSLTSCPAQTLPSITSYLSRAIQHLTFCHSMALIYCRSSYTFKLSPVSS